MIAFVIDNGGLEYAITKMKWYRDKALSLIKDYENSEYKDSLELMVNYVIDRKK